MILSFCTKCFSATFQSFCTFLSFIFYFYYYLLFYVSVSSSLLSATLFLFVKVLILLSPILSFVHILSKSFSALHTLSLSGKWWKSGISSDWIKILSPSFPSSWPNWILQWRSFTQLNCFSILIKTLMEIFHKGWEKFRAILLSKNSVLFYWVVFLGQIQENNNNLLPCLCFLPVQCSDYKCFLPVYCRFWLQVFPTCSVFCPQILPTCSVFWLQLLPACSSSDYKCFRPVHCPGSDKTVSFTYLDRFWLFDGGHHHNGCSCARDINVGFSKLQNSYWTYTVYVISSESFWFGLEKCLIEVVFQGA